MKILPVVLAALTGMCSAQTSPSIVNKGTAPVRLVSILSKPSDMMASVVLLNSSDKQVTNVSLGLIVSIPQGCASREFRSSERVHSFTVSIDPNANTSLNDLHMSTVGIRKLLARLNGRDIVAQVAVVAATFADGGKWTLTRNTKHYDEDMYGATAQARCGLKESSTNNTIGVGPGGGDPPPHYGCDIHAYWCGDDVDQSDDSLE